MKPIRFCLLLIFVLCAVIVGLTIMYFSMKRRRTYWKNKAIAEARKRLAKDDERDNEHKAEVRKLMRNISEQNDEIAKMRRSNDILRQLNEQLARQHNNDTMRQLEELVKKKEETICP